MRRKRTSKRLSFAVWAAVAIGIVAAVSSGGVRLSPSDITMIETMRDVHRVGIAAGDLAKKRGQAVRVRDYGVMLSREHWQDYERVRALCPEANVACPAEGPADSPLLSRVRAAPAAAFDSQFTAAMVDFYRTALAAARQWQPRRREVQDAHARYVRMLGQDLSMAKELNYEATNARGVARELM